MNRKFIPLMTLMFVISMAMPPTASAWISKNATNSDGTSVFYVQTSFLDGIGATDNPQTKDTPAKTLAVGCLEGVVEILFYERNNSQGTLLFMGNSASAQIKFDNSTTVKVRVEEKSKNILLISDSKTIAKRMLKSKLTTITFKIGGTNWVGKFKTSGLTSFSNDFSRYGCSF